MPIDCRESTASKNHSRPLWGCRTGCDVAFSTSRAAERRLQASPVGGRLAQRKIMWKTWHLRPGRRVGHVSERIASSTNRRTIPGPMTFGERPVETACLRDDRPRAILQCDALTTVRGLGDRIHVRPIGTSHAPGHLQVLSEASRIVRSNENRLLVEAETRVVMFPAS